MNIKCISEDKSKIHLTFDDGPDPNTTPKILKVLKKYNKKATFFCIGEKIEKHPEILKQIAEQGHEIGNHSYSHSYYFDFFRTSKVIKELDKTNKLIKKISGKDCIIFRPPFGVTNPNIAKAVKKLNLETIGWSIRSLDTVKDKKTVLKRLEKAKPGNIVLFHDTKTNTVEILEEFLRLKNKKS
ncbi:MAG: polysaccharide deacetylase family protein [Bacteroidales bacterium]|nr:polysaccharide deacetylase family protein [Bacteroidales bacterium]